MDQQIRANKRKTFGFFCMIFLIYSIVAAAFVLYLEEWLAGIIILVIGLIHSAWNYFSAVRKLIRLSKGALVTRNSHRHLFRMVENMSIVVGIRTPAIYIIDDPGLNAFTAGFDKNKAIIGVTSGLLQSLSEQELEGVLAHEMSHIINGDTKVATLSFALTGGFVAMVYIMYRFGFSGSRNKNGGHLALVILILVTVLGLIAVILTKYMISRHREHLADVNGVAITRYPKGLAGALTKIQNQGSALNVKSAHRFAPLCLASPIKLLNANFISRLLSTHPPIAERIARIQQLGDVGI